MLIPAGTVPVEAAVFMREYLNNWYGLNPYYIAKVITDLPLQVRESITMTKYDRIVTFRN